MASGERQLWGTGLGLPQGTEGSHQSGCGALCPALRPTAFPKDKSRDARLALPFPTPTPAACFTPAGPEPWAHYSTTRPHACHEPSLLREYPRLLGARPLLLLLEASSKTHASRPLDSCPRMDAKTAPGALPT